MIGFALSKSFRHWSHEKETFRTSFIPQLATYELAQPPLEAAPSRPTSTFARGLGSKLIE